MDLIVCGFDDRHFAEMHRHAVVRHQRNADFDGVVIADFRNGDLRLVERFEHVFDLGNDEVEGVAVAKDVVRSALLLQTTCNDAFRKLAVFVYSGLEVKLNH